MLNKLLADLAVLYQKQRNYHWNMSGSGFMALHKFLEAEYDAFAEFIDETAEVIRMQGKTPLSTFKEFLDNASLKEGDSSLGKVDMMNDLISDYESLLRFVKKQESDDKNVDDLFVSLIKHLEKAIWLMKSEMA